MTVWGSMPLNGRRYALGDYSVQTTTPRSRSPVPGVLAVEGGERRQQPEQVHHAGGVLVEAAAEFARHHLGVDGVRHARRLAGVDQPQVVDVLQIPHFVDRVAAGEDRLYDAPHPLKNACVYPCARVRDVF